MQITIYTKYITHLKKTENNVEEIQKNLYKIESKEDMFWIEILKMFINNEKKIQKETILYILDNSFKNNALNYSLFLNYLLYSLIDYYYAYSNKKNEEILKIFKKEKNISLINMFLSLILNNNNDKIKNYPIIEINLNNIDNYYNEYLNDSFNTFINLALKAINNKENSVERKNLHFLIRLFNFIAEIRIDNEDDKLYKSISSLIFELTTDGVTNKLDDHINNYKDKDNIKNSIKIYLTQYLQKDFKNLEQHNYGYLCFLKYYSN